MKLWQFLVGIVVLNVAALIYVHQYANLVRVSYEIKKNESSFRGLLEENRSLNGEILQLKSPEKMLKILASNDVDLKVPGEVQVIRLVQAGPGTVRKAHSSDGLIGGKQKRGHFFAFLGLSSQAEAKTDGSFVE